MQINVAALQTIVDETLAADKKAHEERHDAAVEKLAKDSTAHAEKYAEGWRTAVRKINHALRTGRPVLDEMMPRTGPWRGDVATYTHDSGAVRAASATYSPDARLTALRKVLDTIVDDTISHTSLSTLGFRDLHGLFRRALNN